MATEVDPSSLGTWIGGGIAAIVAAAISLQAYFAKKKVSDASDESAVKGFKGNDSVLDNLRAEIERLSKRMADLEAKVEHLTDKLANVRLVALDCYQLATDCDCAGESRERLLEHLRTIIKEA